MLALACPSCGAAFKVSDLDHANQLAVCHACAAVLDLKTRTPADDAQLDALTRSEPKAAVSLPAGYTVADQNGAFTVSWEWNRRAGPIFIIAALMGFVGTALMARFAPEFGWFIYVEIPFSLLILFMGLANALNTSTLTLTNGTLAFAHAPLPWPGGTWERGSLAQLYGEERRTSKGAVSYALCALSRDGQRLTLALGLEKHQVRWLEQTFEARMNIVDVPVKGELAK